MINRIIARLRSNSHSVKNAFRGVENLENRVLLSVAQVTNIIADNRGEVIFQMNHALKASTVNGTSVQMHTVGKDGKFGTADDVKIPGVVRYFTGNQRITFRAKGLKANTTYMMKLNSKRLLSSDGTRIDGEYVGGKHTGNGVGGGDTLIISKKATTTQTARFSTAVGAFNVQLFTTETPKNAANFIAYANSARYDSTFFHRSIPGFIIQGGGFNVTAKDALGQVTEFPVVDNEPHVTSNTRGTIALARPDDNNPATDDKGSSQFFFNLADNSQNLDNQNGGFTAFGKVTDANGLAVMDALAAFPTINAGGVFSNLPVVKSGTTAQQVSADPANTLVLIRRVAMLDKIVAFA